MSLQRWDWLRLLLASAGIGVMAYLTVVHYSGDRLLACPSTGVVNCHTVLSSPQAEVLGIAISIPGMVWFAVSGLLAGVSIMRRGGESQLFSNLSLAWTLSGMIVVIYLVYTELAIIHAICLWCTVAHVLIAVMLVIQVLTQPLRTGAPLDSPAHLPGDPSDGDASLAG